AGRARRHGTGRARDETGNLRGRLATLRSVGLRPQPEQRAYASAGRRVAAWASGHNQTEKGSRWSRMQAVGGGLQLAPFTGLLRSVANTTLMILPPVHAIFFDAVGTLIHPEPPAPDVYQAVGQRYGSAVALADIRRRLSAAFHQEDALDRAVDWRTSEASEVE